MHHRLILLLSLLGLLASTTLHAEADPWAAKLNPAGLILLTWDDLMPPDYDADAQVEALNKKYNLEQLEDDDPKVRAIQAELRALWDHAPTVASLDGRRVRLPGLVIPLEADAKRMSEFLLVPYFGACIHVPPPPANQVVYVRTAADGVPVREFYEAVWVEGTLRSEHHANDTGDASYTLDVERVESYEE